MIVIISGPINAGKSTVGRQLVRLLPGSIFIDGDDLAPAHLPNPERWSTAIDLIGMASLSVARAQLHLFVAYPMSNDSWKKLSSPLQAEGYAVTCVVLAPPLEIALSERGERTLSDWERARIPVMYDEGYQNPSFASLVIDNSVETADMTAQRICDHLGLA